MKVISIVNTKGGTGKSTIAINVAVALANLNKKVLLIDTDGQQQSSLSFCQIRLAQTENEKLPIVSAVSLPDKNIHKTLDNYSSFDFVIIDAGAGDNGIVRSAILCSNKGILLIPVQPSVPDLWGTEDTLKILADARQMLEGYEKNYLIFNRVPTNIRINFTKAAFEKLKEIEIQYEVKSMQNTLSERTAFKEAIPFGKNVQEYCVGRKKDDKAIIELQNVVSEILNILEGE